MTTTDAPDLAGAKFGIANYAGEQAMLLGAGSTVMYQLAMKGVGLGVAEHSTTLTRPVDRLRTTLTYIYVMSWGTDAEKKAVSRMVNKMHRSVRSEGRYSAYDPDLQLWVAATLVKNGEWLFEKIFGPMDAATKERCYRESWIFGTALQVKPDQWPPTRAAFDEYWDEALTRLEPDPIVQEYVEKLLTPRGILGVTMPLQSLMTRGNLDPRTREILALPWSARDQRRYDLFWKLFVPVYRLVPRPLRQVQARLTFWDMRRRLRKGKRVI
jgi:uncharacterized protein (DUF2236 family)